MTLIKFEYDLNFLSSVSTIRISVLAFDSRPIENCKETRTSKTFFSILPMSNKVEKIVF